MFIRFLKIFLYTFSVFFIVLFFSQELCVQLWQINLIIVSLLVQIPSKERMKST